MSERDRVRWHCRRGMLELDLVLKGFLDRELEALTPGQLAAFKALLEFSDNDLWDLVSGRYQPAEEDNDTRAVMRLLRQA